MLSYRDAGSLPPLTAPVSQPSVQLVADWQAHCPGPLTTGKPCAGVNCPYRMTPAGGEEECLYLHGLRALAGTLDPNEAVKTVSQYMAALVPEIRRTRQSMVDVANAIQRALAPLWVKAMILIWGLATSAQVLAWISMVVSQL